MKRGTVFLLFVIFIFIIGICQPAQSELLKFDLNLPFNGDSPTGTSPWLTATFEDVNVTVESKNYSVKLKLDATNLAQSSNGSDQQFVTTWQFNTSYAGGFGFSPITPVVTSPQIITITSPNPTDIINLIFKFQENNSDNGRFSAGETYEIYLRGLTSLLTASSFNALAGFKLNDNEGNAVVGPYYSIAKVQGIPLGSDKEGSGWIATGPATTVPEPATMLLLGFGLMGMAFIGRRKFRK